jgi:sortase A
MKEAITVKPIQDTVPRSIGRSHRFSSGAEFVAWVTGVVLLIICAGTYVEGLASSRLAVRRFLVLQAAARQQVATNDVSLRSPDDLRSLQSSNDLSLWSPGRIDAWRSSLSLPSPPPLAVLRIPKIKLEVPVLKGTDNVTLNRGVGHIEGTASPGTRGNSGIAGHRDGFFRGLKDIVAGDSIVLDTLQGKEIYHVDRIWIVNPREISVLNPTVDRSLTLVTCYPFYFIGSAPQRYIVRATIRSIVPAAAFVPTN